MTMTDGMKSGAGSDPFADDSNDQKTTEEAKETNQEQEISTKTNREQERSKGHVNSPDGSIDSGSEDLPYIFSRNGVKDNRTMVQYFLREETEEIESEVQHSVEQELGTDVYLTDIREALVRIGAEHLDEVAGELREWGYRYKEE